MAYYLTDGIFYPTNDSNTTDGLPNTAWLGLSSLDSSGCNAVQTDSTNFHPIGSIIRALPTDHDPVQGKPYPQLYPNGATVNGWYYAYAPWKNKSCASQATLQAIDAAFSTAVKGTVAETNQNTATFTMPELHAKMTLPDGLTPTDLQYAISTSTGVSVANFTTTSLEQADGTNSCRADQAPIGVIWRTTQNPTSGAVIVKHIGQYYYAFEKPQGSCTGNLNAVKLEQSQTALLQQAFETITANN